MSAAAKDREESPAVFDDDRQRELWWERIVPSSTNGKDDGCTPNVKDLRRLLYEALLDHSDVSVPTVRNLTPHKHDGVKPHSPQTHRHVCGTVTVPQTWRCVLRFKSASEAERALVLLTGPVVVLEDSDRRETSVPLSSPGTTSSAPFCLRRRFAQDDTSSTAQHDQPSSDLLVPGQLPDFRTAIDALPETDREVCLLTTSSSCDVLPTGPASPPSPFSSWSRLPIVPSAGVPLPQRLVDDTLHHLRSLQWPRKRHRDTATIHACHYAVVWRGRPRPAFERLYPLLEQIAAFGAGRAICSVTKSALAAWTHIAVTKNFKGSPHVDSSDQTPQLVVSLGDFGRTGEDHDVPRTTVPRNEDSKIGCKTENENHVVRCGGSGGGDLCVLETTTTSTDTTSTSSCLGEDHVQHAAGPSVLHVVTTRNRVAAVDGRYLHFVTGYTGERFSLVFYCLEEAKKVARGPAVLEMADTEFVDNHIVEHHVGEEEDREGGVGAVGDRGQEIDGGGGVGRTGTGSLSE